MTVDYYTNGYERISECELTQRYRDDLDGIYGEIKLGELTFLPSKVIEELDTIAFRCGFADWTDSEGWEETDDDGDEGEDGEEGNETSSSLLSSELDCYD